MAHAVCYEQYPLRIVLLCNSLSIATYLIGGFLLLRFDFIFLFIYLLLILTLEARLLNRSCTNCYYYGRSCAFGKGRLSAIFIQKSTEGFGREEIAWMSVLPDFLVSMIPIAAGIVSLAMSFELLTLVLILLLTFLSTIGNGFVRGSLACKFCKQREIGCPAEKLFNKRKSKA